MDFPSPTEPPPRQPVVTVVHSEACHFCADAREALGEVQEEFDLRIVWIAAGSDAGQDLVRRLRAPMFPLVLLDGELFSWGRLPRKKLRKRLEQRYAETRAGATHG